MNQYLTFLLVVTGVVIIWAITWLIGDTIDADIDDED